MSLVSGTRLGPYVVDALIGSGGMGEVYRARDPRLNRDVAVKVLPVSYSADPERLRRFELEARAAAALNHPNILAVYDIGQHGDLSYIVSELLDGETLRARLASSPSLPLRTVLDYSVQIVRGLAAAHDAGVVHRDLKPENIFITRSGHVKILDFGLAKLARPEPAAVSLMTATGLDTDAGTVLGTLGYMSPEQVRGRAADHRSDIFAVGAILYEMLSGSPAFKGDSSADVMTAVLREVPPLLAAVTARVPAPLIRIVERCLEKDPAARFQSTHDLAFALEGVQSPSAISAATPVSRDRWRAGRWIAAAVVTLVVAAALVVAIGRLTPRRQENPAAVRFVLDPPGNVTSSSTSSVVAVSPDGRRLAFVASNSTGTPMLWVRALDSLDAQLLAGTEGARGPFWSWDGQVIAFFAFGKLKKIAAGGGPLQTICDVYEIPTAGTWSRDGVVLFSALSGGIRRVPAGGGTPSPASAVNEGRHEQLHLYPQFLPDGRHFLYYARSTSPDQDGIYVKTIDSDATRLVVHASSNFAFVNPGYLLYARDGALLAQPFDAARAETTGDPFTVADHVEQFAETALAAFSASESGVLVYRTSRDSARSRLVWFDRHGNRIGTIGDAAPYRNPRLSPDGRRVAVEMVDTVGNRDVWLIEVGRGLPTRFTFDPGRDAAPVWSADGREIAWVGNARLYAKPSTGTGREQNLSEVPWIPDDWLPDGSGLLCHATSPRQILLLPLRGGDRKVRPVVQSRGIVTQARVSPDGRWIAFADNASGRFEVFVQDFAGGTERWQISTEGGIQPKWGRDGKELFYLAFDGTIMSVSVSLGALAEIGKPRPLFQSRIEPATGFVWHQYDLTPDGQRFLVNAAEAVKVPLTVVINWPATVKQ